jgi:hypothetical protein
MIRMRRIIDAERRIKERRLSSDCSDGSTEETL